MPIKTIEEGFNTLGEFEDGLVTDSFEGTITISEELTTNFGAPPTIYTASISTPHFGYARPGISWTRIFESWPLTRDAIQISLTERIDTLQITLSNVGWSRFLGYLRDEDYHGKRVKVWQGFLDIEKEEANLAELFEGEIDRINFDEQAIVINLKGNARYLERSGLGRSYSVYCPFKFKSRQCGYVGPDTSCDKSYSDCNGRGNSQRFGGYRTLLRVQGSRDII